MLRLTHPFFLLLSCMKALSFPLCEVQLEDPDTSAESPLRDFATEILVFIHHNTLLSCCLVITQWMFC